MRSLFIILFWSFIATCYALKITALESPVIAASPYLEWPHAPLSTEKNADHSEPFPLPVKSHITAGVLHKHSAKNNGLSQPFFVVGDDLVSRTWLKNNAAQLKKMNALGFVTNVATGDSLNELTQLAGMPLQALNVDELVSLLGVNHYPFAYEQGVVWQ